MGIYDREYIRFGPRSSSGLGAMRMLSVNTWLILINVAVFVLDQLLFQNGRGVSITVRAGAQTAQIMPPLTALGFFSTAKAFLSLEIWRFVTFQFLHANFTHILFNMIGLYFFGGLVEGYLGRKRYLAFYLMSGVCGALMYLLLNLLGQFLPGVPGLIFNDIYTPLIGASAGVFGVLLAAAFIAPNALILIFFLLPMRLATAVYLFVALVVLNLLTNGANAGGDAAHLGGILAGAYFIRHPHLLRDFFDGVWPFGRGSGGPGRAGRQRRDRPRGGGPSEAEIDRILAKVQAQGLHSLTESERKTLRKATEARKH